jgi:transcriptional regulator with XRE-family HTH domain
MIEAKQDNPSMGMGRPSRTVADRQKMREVGTRLKWVREALRLSQAAIAEKVGLHQTAWSLYERGLRYPDQFEVVRLAAKLQISIPYLLEARLEGVERGLAIRLAARHPELADPIDTEPRTGTGRP